MVGHSSWRHQEGLVERRPHQYEARQAVSLVFDIPYLSWARLFI